MAKRTRPDGSAIDGTVSLSEQQFNYKKHALEHAIVQITDGSMQLTREERDDIKPGVSDADALTDPDIVTEQERKNSVLAEERIGRLFRIQDTAHPEFRFVYPPEQVADRWGFTTVSSLKDGVWAAVINATNEAFWAERVAALKFVQHNRMDDNGGYALGYYEMTRVLGEEMVMEMLDVAELFTLQGADATGDQSARALRDRARILRRIFLSYLLSYNADASLSFLTLFVHNLLLTPRYARDSRGVLRQIPGANMLAPVKDHLDHLLIDPPSWLRRDTGGMETEEESTTASSSTREKEVAEPEPEPPRPYDPRRKTSVMLASTQRHLFVTTLELHLADTTLRYEISQPDPLCGDCLQFGGEFPVLYIDLQLDDAPLGRLQARVDVGDLVQRVFKFYYKADVDYLLLYVVLAKGRNRLLRMPCRTVDPVHSSVSALFDATQFNDVFFIDAVNCPYETNFCTWQKASTRLEPGMQGDGLKIMTTAAIYQRTVTNVAATSASSSSSSRAWRDEMRSLTVRRQELDTEMLNLAKQIKDMTEEADRNAKAMQPRADALQSEISALVASLADKSPNGPRPTQIPILNRTLAERRQALEALKQSIAARYDAVGTRTDELNKKRAQHAAVSDEILALKETKRGSGGDAAAPTEIPIALGVRKFEPLPIKVRDMEMTQKQDRYVSVLDLSGLAGQLHRDQRIVHAARVVTIPGDGSGITDEALRANVGDHCNQIVFNDATGDVEYRTTYATVAVLCERPQYTTNLHIFEIHFYKYALDKSGAAYMFIGPPIDATVPGREEQTLRLRDPSLPFRVVDFELIFYDDNMGRCYCIQAEIEELDSGERYTTCSQSRRELLNFLRPYRPQEVTSVPPNLLALFDLLSFRNGYRTVRFPTSDLTRVRYNYMFYKQHTADSVRFIFMKLGGGVPSVYQIDVEGMRLEWISSFSPIRQQGRGQGGFLYLMIDEPVLNSKGLITGQTRRVLQLGSVGDDVSDYDERVAPWFLTARLSRMNLQASCAPVVVAKPLGAHRPCAWCAEPTTLQDEATHRYYCDELCQALLCTTKRLM